MHRTTPLTPGVTWWRTSATVAAALLMLSGCGYVEVPTTTEDSASAEPTQSVAPSPTPEATTPAPTPEPSEPTAEQLLATLAVKGRAPTTDYDRDRFGQAWLDADRNGCDTRNDILKTYLTETVFKPGTRDCVVLSGTLDDPYTGTLIDFVYGDGTLVDIDHVVALGNAWATGALRWDIKKRAALANDPLNLLPVDASANRQKSDGDAATWLPANKSFRCEYVARQVSVKAKYDLWVTPPEVAAFTRVLADCPGQPPIPDSGAPIRVDQNITDPGASPVRRGDPGYGSHLDRDNDGGLRVTSLVRAGDSRASRLPHPKVVLGPP